MELSLDDAIDVGVALLYFALNPDGLRLIFRGNPPAWRFTASGSEPGS